ncbi:VOC family protein [Amaricoccus sp.]|uniref:VOC family protein n=1 Tax=Amaricoccus sp. TaxID=1872485 RepID=UPI002614A782|nr:VOC family protein [uncultured Amaricoccus sp.]
MTALSHFEIFGDEPEKLAELYAALFGWRIEQAPGVDYWRIRNGDGAAQSIGGLARRPSFELRGWLAYFQVPSVTDAIATVERHGGRVLKERTAVPRTAWYAVIADPADNAFAVWEPDPLAFPPPEPD